MRFRAMLPLAAAFGAAAVGLSYLPLQAQSEAQPALAANAIPTNAAPTNDQERCTVSAEDFKKNWVTGGSASNPVIGPPESFTAPFQNDCDFYKWGAQMFLWLTSSTEGADLVFDSAGFFDVVHRGEGSEKIANVEVLPNGGEAPNVFALRSVKPDERGGSGQAGGGGVLLSQSGSLTYYGMHVNDAYVAFRNGYAADRTAFDFTDRLNTQGSQFPSTPEDMSQVVAYGLETGLITGDPDRALAAGTLELKTSWVDAAGLDPAEFLTIEAQVPAFDRSDPAKWTANGTETRRLAMVGMHIAGPVVGHPELVWISYEHLSNSPMASYVYNTSDGPVTQPFDGSGAWIFATDVADPPGLIAPVASLDASGNIVAAEGKIAPQTVVQINPWGNAPATLSETVADNAPGVVSNTALVSLNASLLALLANDANARDRYYQLGGVWTTGVLPTYQDYSAEIGGLNLANSTMETFHQFGAQNPEANGFAPRNCFDCHSVSGPNGKPENNLGVSVSHIFQGMSVYNQRQ